VGEHRGIAQKDESEVPDLEGSDPMVAASGLTIVDTNVFVIDLRYRRDRNFKANRRLLDRIARDDDGATTLFNVLEVCGILSFNLNAVQVRELFFHFPAKYGIRIVPAASVDRALPELTVGELLEAIAKKASLGDALLAATIEKHAPGATRFVSWDADHFRDKLSVPVFTPKEYLRGDQRRGP
jgi:predicted nucleic acid-binding protein